MDYDIRKTDIEHIWHPYTNMLKFRDTHFPVIEKAKGLFLYTTEGRKLYDGIASWWCVNLGHSNKKLLDAMNKQSKLLQHSILGGLSHKPIIELSDKLSKICPGDLNHFFYAGDGSCAVEAALKISLQYWKLKGDEGRSKFICLEDGYHGDTLGSVSVGYVDTFHKYFRDFISENHIAASPNCSVCPHNKNCGLECFESMKSIIEKNHKETAAVIVEPLCQGAAGIRIYPSEYLRKLRKLCDKYNLLLIFDEIAVGFGRTGKMFASETAGVIPDIMTFGKGLTGGYLPMSAAAVSDRIYNVYLNTTDKDPVFYHGHTYTGNPICSALALKVLEIYSSQNILNNIYEKSALLKEKMEKIASILDNSYTSTLGLISEIHINESAGGAKAAQQIASNSIEAGLFIRPLGSTIYLWPPLVSTMNDLHLMTDIMEKAALNIQ